VAGTAKKKASARVDDANQPSLLLTDLTLYDIISVIPVLEKASVTNWTSSGLSKRKAARKKISSRAPYGYKFDGDRVVSNESEQQVIKEVIALSSQGLRNLQISRVLAARGKFNRNGKPIDHSSISKILTKNKQIESNSEKSRKPIANVVDERPEVVRVSLTDFETFLRSQDNELWDADHLEFESLMHGKPSTVDNLMGTITMYSHGDSDYLYVFSSTDAPYEIANRTDWKNVPDIDSEGLSAYVIGNVRGADFLYFACTIEQAANGDYVTLLPWPEEDE